MRSKQPLRSTVRAMLLATGAAGLTACYVIPMNPDGSPAWYPPPPPPAVVVAPPAAQPMPVIPASYQARLYPMNEQAAQTGPLVATITDLNTGRGLLMLTMAGEQLSGEATRVSDSHPGFGSVYEKVLRTPVRTSPGQPKGIANATGQRGTWVNCEYVLERNGRGTGACLMSNGAAYQIHFGS
jgi:hypothetical protein